MTLFFTCHKKRRTCGRMCLSGVSITRDYISIGAAAYRELGSPSFIQVHLLGSRMQLTASESGYSVHRTGGRYQLSIRHGLGTLLTAGKYELVGGYVADCVHTPIRKRGTLKAITALLCPRVDLRRSRATSRSGSKAPCSRN